jgi:hypothetical protein
MLNISAIVFLIVEVQNGSGAHQAAYPTGTRGFYPGGKATEA